MSAEILARLEAVAQAITDRVPGLAVVRSLDETIRPPAAVITPPSFTWNAYSPDPDGITGYVVIVEPESDRALANLLGWVTPVSQAIHSATDAYVVRAVPDGFRTSQTGSTPLPAYLLEVAL